jgi:hypothetical protein
VDVEGLELHGDMMFDCVLCIWHYENGQRRLGMAVTFCISTL